MKRLILWLLLCPWLAAAASSGTIGLTLDRVYVPLDHPPVVYRGQLLVPLFGIFHNLGADIEYLNPKRVMVKRGNRVVTFMPGSPEAVVDGAYRQLEVPAVVLEGSLMVPLRFVRDVFGVLASWDAARKTVHLLSRTGGPANIQAFSVPMRVAGIMVDSLARYQSAVVKAGGKSFLVHPGDQVGGYVVERILRDKVILSKEGKRLELSR